MVKITKKKVRNIVPSNYKPPQYRPEYCQMIIDFFSPPHYLIKDMTITKPDGTQIDKTEMEALPPIFLSDFARSIGIKRGYRQLLAYWAEKYPEFSDSLKEAKDLEIERIRVNASMNLYSASFSIFTMKNIAEWRDEQYLKGDPSKIIIINIDKYANSQELQTARPAMESIQR